MPNEAAKKSLKELMSELSAQATEDLMTAHERGKKVCWASAVIPQEFLLAMDIEVGYPESQAAVIAAKGETERYLSAAMEMGYSNDICSYARIGLGYASIMECDAMPLPKPDFLICINNACQVMGKWFENVAERFQIPLILIDAPYNTQTVVTADRIEYIKAQFRDLIQKLEVICGKPFNYQKLYEVMEVSRQTAAAWKKVIGYPSMVPSPMNGFNESNYMSQVLTNRGKPRTVELLNAIAQEMEEHIANGTSQVRHEQKYRIFWNGILCWPYLSYIAKILKEHNIIFCVAPYALNWLLEYDAEDIDGLARVYANRNTNCCTETNVEARAKIMEDYHIDGILYHLNRSCKSGAMSLPEIVRQIYAKNGIPYMIFDGDQSDPNNFSKAQFEMKLQALVEAMESNRQKRGESS